MQETDTKRPTNSLKEEMDSWKPFTDALREDDRNTVRSLFDKVWRFADAIESSMKRYLVEPLFMAILITQEERIRWLESEVKKLREEVDAWKSKAGS